MTSKSSLIAMGQPVNSVHDVFYYEVLLKLGWSFMKGGIFAILNSVIF